MRLSRLIESMPAELRKRYEEAAAYRRSTDLQERLKVCVALHLWRKGLRNIEFEKDLQLGGGKLAYVDVFENRQKIIVECETRLDESKMRKRSKALRKALPTVRLALAVPDRTVFSRRMALKARRVAKLVNDVWLVTKSGEVVDLNTGIKRYRRRIKRLLKKPELKKLMSKYGEIKADLEEIIELRDSVCGEAKGVLRNAAKLVLGRKVAGDLVEVEVVNPVLERQIEGFRKWMESVRAEILRSIVEVANEILSINTNSVLELKNGKQGIRCLVHMDEDTSEWLGWSDRPIT